MFENSILGQYTRSLAQYMPQKLALAIILMLVLTLTEGVSLVLLIPLLELVGLNMGQGFLNQVALVISDFFYALGLEPTLLMVLALYVVVVSFRSLLTRWETVLHYDLDFSYAAHLRKELYQAITNSSWLFFSRNKASDFAHALTNEMERIGTGTSQFLTLLSTIMILLVYALFALELAGVITGLIFLAGAFILLFLKNKAYSSRHRGEDITVTTRKIYSSIMQHLEGMKTIKSFGLEEKNLEIFSQENDQVVHSYLESIKSYADVRLLFDIGTVVMLAVIVLFLIQVIHLPTATLLVLIYLFVRMFPLFSTIQSTYQYVLTMLPAYRNVKDLERRCLENKEPSRHGTDRIKLKGDIKLENVSFSYPENHFTIQGLDLSIPVGKTTALAGPSGAGKSTIADLVMGLIQPDSGQLTMDGRPFSSGRNNLGYVAQDTFLFNESVRFNLLVARPDAVEDELMEALELAAADEFVSQLPDGLDTVIGDRGVRLSGGERQRLALARALLRKPDLLILDEATSNLDSENEKRIIKAIDNLHGEMTILIIAHRLSTIKNADQIYLLEEGRIQDSGTWSELLEKDKGWLWDIRRAQDI